MNARRKGTGKPRRTARWWRWAGVLVLAGVVSVSVLYALLERREQQRRARLDAFLRLDARYECCTVARAPLPDRCRRVLDDLIDLSHRGNVTRPVPEWVPAPFRLYLNQSRGADPVSQQALVLYWQCPNAQEIVHQGIATPTEALCAVSGTWEERENLAREAARRGTLIKALIHLGCSEAGFDAGLRRIQTDFSLLCTRDACLNVLLRAPVSLRSRVREIVAAHPDAVLTALAPQLVPGGDTRVDVILTDVLGRDAGAIAALARGTLDGLDQAPAMDLLELPLNPRKAFLLRRIRDRGSDPEASVAAVFLDAAEAATASVAELREGLRHLARHQCLLVEKAIERLELGSATRADAALPALEICPEAAQAALGDDSGRFALTRRVMEAVLQGRLVDVAPLLLDRLDRSDTGTLATFLRLSRRRDLEPAAMPILRALRRSSAVRFRLLLDALPSEEAPRQSRQRSMPAPTSPPADTYRAEPEGGYGPEADDGPAQGEAGGRTVDQTVRPEPSPTEEQLLIRELRKLGIPTPAAGE